MKSKLVWKSVYILSIVLCLLSAAFCIAESSEDEVIELSVTVPFGITVGEKKVPVYNQALRGTVIDRIDPDLICAVDKAEAVGEDRWYHVHYFVDDSEHVGTISGQYFYLFSVPDLVEATSDPDAMSMIQALLALPSIAATSEGSASLDADISEIGFSVSQSVAESPIKYVLNTSTKRIHTSTCDSVNKMKLKNRKDIMDENEIYVYLEQGYVGCAICNPRWPENVTP